MSLLVQDMLDDGPVSDEDDSSSVTKLKERKAAAARDALALRRLPTADQARHGPSAALPAAYVSRADAIIPMDPLDYVTYRGAIGERSQ